MGTLIMELASNSLGQIPMDAVMIGDPTKGPGCFSMAGPKWRDKYPGPAFVRRPTMGLELKAERQAWMQIQDSSGSIIPLYNGVGGYNPPASKQALFPGGEEKSLGKSDYYTDFFLTSVQEQRSEKVQIVETFGEGYVFGSGERPRILSCTGHLINSKDFMWRAQFWENYNRYLRGTKLIEAKARIYLAWDDNLVEGMMFSANAIETADNRDLINFSFNLLVTDAVSLAALRFNDVASISRVGIRSVSERVKRGELDIYNGVEVAATSRGMRTRQRLAAMKMFGKFLAMGGVDLLADFLTNPEAALEKLGADTLGRVLDVGNDLVFEQAGSWFGLGGEPACLPKVLTGKVLMREWWQDAMGWITSILEALKKVGYPAPWWVYQLRSSPLEFIKVAINQNVLGIKGSALVALGVFGGLLLSGSLLAGSDFPIFGNLVSDVKGSSLAPVADLFPSI